MRAQAQAVLGEGKLLPDAHIYVGMGHHSHRLACSKWAANEISGIYCGGDNWLPHYVAHTGGDDVGVRLPHGGPMRGGRPDRPSLRTAVAER